MANVDDKQQSLLTFAVSTEQACFILKRAPLLSNYVLRRYRWMAACVYVRVNSPTSTSSVSNKWEKISPFLVFSIASVQLEPKTAGIAVMDLPSLPPWRHPLTYVKTSSNPRTLVATAPSRAAINRSSARRGINQKPSNPNDCIRVHILQRVGNREVSQFIKGWVRRTLERTALRPMSTLVEAISPTSPANCDGQVNGKFVWRQHSPIRKKSREPVTNEGRIHEHWSLCPDIFH